MNESSYFTEHMVREHIATLLAEAERERLARQADPPRQWLDRLRLFDPRRLGRQLGRRHAGAVG